MHIISLYLVLHAYAVTFDVMCVKKTEATKRSLKVPPILLTLRSRLMDDSYYFQAP
jgi:hypothetical protein